MPPHTVYGAPPIVQTNRQKLTKSHCGLHCTEMARCFSNGRMQVNKMWTQYIHTLARTLIIAFVFCSILEHNAVDRRIIFAWNALMVKTVCTPGTECGHALATQHTNRISFARVTTAQLQRALDLILSNVRFCGIEMLWKMQAQVESSQLVTFSRSAFVHPPHFTISTRPFTGKQAIPNAIRHNAAQKTWTEEKSNERIAHVARAALFKTLFGKTS